MWLTLVIPMQGGYRSAQATTSAIVPPEKPATNGKAAPGDAKKAGKVVFGGGNRLLAAKVRLLYEISCYVPCRMRVHGILCRFRGCYGLAFGIPPDGAGFTTHCDMSCNEPQLNCDCLWSEVSSSDSFTDLLRRRKRKRRRSQ